MRTGHLKQGRPAYYDRNPTLQSLFANTTIGEGSTTTALWSYTVPSNKKAYVQNAYSHVIILVAPTSASQQAETAVFCGSTVVTEANVYGGAYGKMDSQVVASTGVFPAGTIVNASAWDGNVAGAGSYAHKASALVIEFDA